MASPPSRRLQGKLYRRQYVLQLLQSKLLWRSNQPIDIVTRALEQSGAVRVFITEPMLVALNREVTSTINLDQHLHSASKVWTVLSHAQPRGWVSTGDACLKSAALRCASLHHCPPISRH